MGFGASRRVLCAGGFSCWRQGAIRHRRAAPGVCFFTLALLGILSPHFDTCPTRSLWLCPSSSYKLTVSSWDSFLPFPEPCSLSPCAAPEQHKLQGLVGPSLRWVPLSTSHSAMRNLKRSPQLSADQLHGQQHQQPPEQSQTSLSRAGNVINASPGPRKIAQYKADGCNKQQKPLRQAYWSSGSHRRV